MDEWECGAGLEGFVFVFELIFSVGLNAFGAVDIVFIFQVKECSGGDADDETIV